ncbi:bifunctional riboflavin kinase/FAD synthetase [Sediminibacillus dalangtanensis]|uniref:Riboflavin biosynthesis protein n=1 Tax=Sediminibacillus dalangtanensis TaxID=2729421 RepID=A0ABX7VQA3_9BACI|nr:bifunctional riboflavin kinase/FAD synthetase [Sediminibacillus dalangtanensis]QTM98821.1 bifunctional riboflavin kinase/FAD synthetase [Sediminibacillus dalangtanensis]
MEIIQIQDAPPANNEPIILCIGKFDGVHLGHQSILRQAGRLKETGQSLAVMTFHPHPLWALKRDERYRQCVTPSREKYRQLERLGVSKVYEIEFTEKYAETTPETFVYQHLSLLNIKGIVVGEGFNFGKGRKSDTDLLTDLSADIGIPVTIAPLMTIGGQKISSTDIRASIREGQFEKVNTLLGRNYSVNGKVVEGDALGRKLGFPTANLAPDGDYELPGSGVYLGSVEIATENDMAGECWYALINAGYRPTVNGKDYLIEAYLLDFSGDLYGKSMKVSFIQKMREEENFASLDELIKQMNKDKEEARVKLGLNNHS